YLLSCAFAALLSGAGTGAARADEEAAKSNNTGIEVVVVTAEHREESVQDVGNTIQALTGDSLSKLNLTNLDEILKFTPNVVYSAPGAGQSQIAIRGLSTGRAGEQSYATVGGFPNVAVYLDEASMQFPGRNPDIFIADMQRVELLEGPQGTLFGG